MSVLSNVVLVWLQKGTFSFSFFQGCLSLIWLVIVFSGQFVLILV